MNKPIRYSPGASTWIRVRLLVVPWLLCSTVLALAEARRPFPQHVPYTPGVLKPSHVTQAVMDAAVVTHYAAWKSNYVKSLAGSSPVQKWIKYDNTDSTVSEAMGYGMVLAAYMGDQTDFDAMYHFIKEHPSTIGKNLLAWKQTLKKGVMRDVSGADSATDGDMDTAFALMLADRQWGSAGPVNYQAQALLILADLMTHCVNPSDWNLLVGDWAGGTDVTHSRSSDFMVDHLLAFSAFDTARSAKWRRVYDRVTATVNHQFTHGSADTGLMGDFYVKSGPDFVPVSGHYLESPHDGDLFYNSCRTPWRLAMAYILTGRAEIRDSQVKTAGWIAAKTRNQASAIKAGYFVKNGINGTAIADDADLPFTAPFAVNAMLGGNQVWLDRLWSSITGGDYGTRTSYYGDAIRLHVLLVVSGNYWLPTDGR